MGWSLPSAAELPVGTPVWWWQHAKCNAEHLEERPIVAGSSHGVLASCSADAVAPHPGGAHPDKVRRHALDPRLEPGIDERRVLSLGIQMMRRPAYQHMPPLTRFQVELVGLHGDLVLGLGDASTQLLVKEDGVPRAEDDRPCVDLVHDRQRREPVPAGVDQTPKPPAGKQLYALGFAQALHHAPGTQSGACRTRTAGRVEVGLVIRHSSTP